MTKRGWCNKIKRACMDAGTYQRYFEQAIDTLADILTKRDAAQAAFDLDGGKVLTTYTNKGGGENQTVHPALKLVNDYNRDALTYWRDLGLTPAGLRKINEDALRPRRTSPLAEALRAAGGG